MHITRCALLGSMACFVARQSPAGSDSARERRGRDLVLNPPQQGEPLNYFVFPYAEIDGKPQAGIETMVSYRDLV